MVSLLYQGLRLITSCKWQTVATPHCSINRTAPYESYNANAMDYFFRTLDVMAEFPNTLGALAAYKAVIGGITEACTPVIAAVVRDLKKYMKLKYEATGQRILPIGYCAATTHPRDKMILDYLSSQTEAERIDFWTVSAILGQSWVRSQLTGR